jgi:hypothetical protein
MDYPGFNSFWNLSEEVVDRFLESQPQKIEELYERFRKDEGRNVNLDWRHQVPLSSEHIRQVLTENLAGFVEKTATGWKLIGPRPPYPPIWKMFPYPWGSMGYRMGPGETYWNKWEGWYQSLSAAEQEQYRVENPEPDSWQHFYEMISITPRDRDGMFVFLDKRDAAEKAHFARVHELARQCEQRGESDEACYYYSRIAQSASEDFPDAENAFQRLLRQLD